jgi:hypothetical protein
MVLPPFAVLVWGLDFMVAACSALVVTGAVLLLNPMPARARERGPSAVTP